MCTRSETQRELFWIQSGTQVVCRSVRNLIAFCFGSCTERVMNHAACAVRVSVVLPVGGGARFMAARK
jgi:hypothetical protein